MKQNLYFYLVLFGGLLLISCDRTGCNDPLALNYDSKANISDGSCEYNINYKEINKEYIFKTNVDSIQASNDPISNHIDSILSGYINSSIVSTGELYLDIDQNEMIDLYLVHWPDSNVDIRETFEVLVRAQEEGKLKYIGLSNTNAEDFEKAREVGVVSVCQAQDSFFHSTTRDTLFDTFADAGGGFMSWGTLEKGILTGRAKPDRVYDDKDVRNHAPWWTSVDHSPFYETMEQLKPLLQDTGHTGLELALAHALSSPTLSTALCGARTPEQIDGLIAALANLPTSDVLGECHQIRRGVFDSF